jgi:hypothetical protein
MINEEKILSAAFPEYRAYAARTPLVACRAVWALKSRLISRAFSIGHRAARLP